MDKTNKILLFLIAVVLALIIIIGVGGVVYLSMNSKKAITTFAECAAAGNPVQESYPRKCTANGVTFTEVITTPVTSYPVSSPVSSPVGSGNSGIKPYGSSTNASCSTNADCVVMGCNQEICQGAKEEARASICIAPEAPTFAQAGYTCGCNQGQCYWSK